jgi:hypothetical protein
MTGPSALEAASQPAAAPKETKKEEKPAPPAAKEEAKKEEKQKAPAAKKEEKKEAPAAKKEEKVEAPAPKAAAAAPAEEGEGRMVWRQGYYVDNVWQRGRYQVLHAFLS